MNNDPLNLIHKSRKQKNKACANNLKEISDQAKQSIYVNKYEPPTGTFSTTFHKPVGEANMYV